MMSDIIFELPYQNSETPNRRVETVILDVSEGRQLNRGDMAKPELSLVKY